MKSNTCAPFTSGGLFLYHNSNSLCAARSVSAEISRRNKNVYRHVFKYLGVKARAWKQAYAYLCDQKTVASTASLGNKNSSQQSANPVHVHMHHAFDMNQNITGLFFPQSEKNMLLNNTFPSYICSFAHLTTLRCLVGHKWVSFCYSVADGR